MCGDFVFHGSQFLMTHHAQVVQLQTGKADMHVNTEDAKTL
jgi:hypothetical protein